MNKEELNKLKVDQIKMLEFYKEQAKEDENWKKFLINMSAKLNSILIELDTKQEDDK